MWLACPYCTPRQRTRDGSGDPVRVKVLFPTATKSARIEFGGGESSQVVGQPQSRTQVPRQYVLLPTPFFPSSFPIPAVSAAKNCGNCSVIRSAAGAWNRPSL